VASWDWLRFPFRDLLLARSIAEKPRPKKTLKLATYPKELGEYGFAKEVVVKGRMLCTEPGHPGQHHLGKIGEGYVHDLILQGSLLRGKVSESSECTRNTSAKVYKLTSPFTLTVSGLDAHFCAYSLLRFVASDLLIWGGWRRGKIGTFDGFLRDLREVLDNCGVSAAGDSCDASILRRK
jgi:hypothetical protein